MTKLLPQLLILAAVFVGTPAGHAQSVTPERLQELVDALASPSWRERSDATQTLLEIGPPAHRILAEACESTDLELRERARYIHARTRYHVPATLALRFPSLLEDLSAEDAERYAGAVESLARYGTPEAAKLALQVIADPIALPLLCPHRHQAERLLTIARSLGPPSAAVFAAHLSGDDESRIELAVLAFGQVLDPGDADACAQLVRHCVQGGARSAQLISELRPRLYSPHPDAPRFAQALGPHAAQLLSSAAAPESPCRAQCLELALLADPEGAADLATGMFTEVGQAERERTAPLRGAIVRALVAAGRLEEALAVPCPHTLGRSMPTRPSAEVANLRATLGETPRPVDEQGSLIGGMPATILAQLSGEGRRTAYRLGPAPVGAALFALAEASGTIPVLDANGRFAFRLLTRDGDVLLPSQGWGEAHTEQLLGEAAAINEGQPGGGLTAAEAQGVMIGLTKKPNVPIYAVDRETIAAISERRDDLLTAIVRRGAIEIILVAKVELLRALDASLAASMAAPADVSALAAIAQDETGDPGNRRGAYLRLGAARGLDPGIRASLRSQASGMIVEAVGRPSVYALEIAEGASSFLIAQGDPPTSDALLRGLVAHGPAAWHPVNRYAFEPVLAFPSDGAISYLTQVLAESDGEDDDVASLVVQLCHRGWHHGEPRLVQRGKRRGLSEIQVIVTDRERRLADFATALADTTGLRVVADTNPDAPLDDIYYDVRRGFQGQSLGEVLDQVVSASLSSAVDQNRDDDPFGRRRRPAPRTRQGLAFVAAGNSILFTTTDRGAILHTLPYASRALRLEQDAGAQLLRWMVPDGAGELLAISRLLAALAGDDPVKKEVARTHLIASSMGEVLEALAAVDNREAARVLKLLTGRRQLDREFLNWLQEELDTR